MSTNYWVDVLFKPAAAPLTTTRTAVPVPAKVAEQKEATGALQLSVQPNPTATAFTLRVQGSGATAPVEVRVVDAVGRLLEVRQVAGTGGTLVVGQQYRPGLYYAQARQGTQKQTLTLLKLVP
jgi:hypothetical protein